MGLEQQRKEIETIRERSLTIKLSDADCERIFNLCGKHNITVACLLENFIGDLVGGTYTNGSDERDFAGKYFERCWFGRYPETTLLNWLLNMGYDIYDDFLEIIDNIESGYAELEDYQKDPTVFDEEEIEFLKGDIEDWEKEISEIKSDFLKDNKEADWEKEVERVNQFWKNRELFVHSRESIA